MEPKKKKSTAREYLEALLTALLVAFFIRSFVIEAFKIPSGSMIPTLMIGDHIFVNKFVYGLRIPFTKKRIVTFGQPRRGESIVFIYPVDESKDFIKRVVGLPGDRIRLHGDELIVNGERVSRMPISVEPNRDEAPSFLQVVPDAAANQIDIHRISVFEGWENFKYYVEKTGDRAHLIQLGTSIPRDRDEEIEVPPDHLFVMGDNRDNSSDSREWGTVPMENVKGRAMFVWLSIDFDRKTLRWDRFGKWIK